MTNEEVKMYAYKQLADILKTDYTVVQKKVKKYQLLVDKKMVNGRLQKVVFLSDEKVSAIDQEIEFNRKNMLPPNNQQIGNQPSTNSQPLGNELPPNEPHKYPAVPDMQVFFNGVKDIYQQLIDEKDKRIDFLQKLNEQAQKENQELKDQLAKKSSFLGLFKK